MKATGPATEVIMPAKAQVQSKIKIRNRRMLTPMEEA